MNNSISQKYLVKTFRKKNCFIQNLQFNIRHTNFKIPLETIKYLRGKNNVTLYFIQFNIRDY